MLKLVLTVLVSQDYMTLYVCVDYILSRFCYWKVLSVDSLMGKLPYFCKVKNSITPTLYQILYTGYE